MQVNGDLVLNALGLSEVRNMVVERVTTLPAAVLSEKGRLVFNMTNSSYYFNNGTDWSIIATGSGLTNAIGEINALEASLGTLVNADGTFNSSALSGTNYITGATTLTQALTTLDASMTANNTIAEMDDVTLTSTAGGQFLVYDATAGLWVNKSSTLSDLFDVTIATPVTKQVVYYSGTEFVNQTLVLTDVSDVTTTAAELNEVHTSGAVLADYVKLHALTATANELNQITGSAVTQADLIKLHALTADATELNYVDGVTSSIQTQLNNKQPLDADLTWLAAQEPVALDSETLTINGEEFTNSNLSQFIISTGSQTDGARWQLASKASARSALGLGDAALLDETNFINATALGTSNVATNISWNNYKLTSLAPGEVGTDAVNLNQLQSAVAGLSWKAAVVVATTATIDLATGGELTIDGVALLAGDRVLVKNQTTASENGLYVVSAGAWTRATDFDAGADNVTSAAVFVEAGTTQADTGWTVTSDVATFGADSVVWTQFNGASGITAGFGLSKTGNTLDLNAGAGIAVTDDLVVIDVYSNTGAIILTEDGAARSGGTDAKVHLLIDNGGTSKLEQGANGLKITAAGVSKVELNADIAGPGLIGAAGSALEVASALGTAATGGDTTTNWAGVGTITVTADAVGVTLGDTSTTAAPGNHTHKAAAITFDNSATSLAGSPADLQAAIVAIDSTLDDVYADLGSVKTAAGLNPTTGEFVQHTTATLASVNSATSLFAVDEALSTAVTNVTAAVADAYAVYTSTSASTTHTITHSCNQKYCLVTVVDSTVGSDTLDQVVIPNSIKYDSANQLTVTFNTAINCVVIINGLTTARAV